MSLNNAQMKTIDSVGSWEGCWQVLESQFSLQLSDLQKNKLIKFHETLHEVNQVMNLTKHDSLSDFATFHVLDTALLMPLINELNIGEQAKYLDLGSGCGVPGVILHIFLEGKLKTTLCDSRKKRANYLTDLSHKLELSYSLRALSERAETLLQNINNRKHFSLLTARAFAKPHEALNLAAPFLSKGGVFLAQTGTSLLNEPEYHQLMSKLKVQTGKELHFQLAGKDRWVTALKKI